MMGQKIETLPDVQLERSAGKTHVLPFRLGRQSNKIIRRDLGDGYFRYTVSGQFPDILRDPSHPPEISAHGSDLPVDTGHDPSLILFHGVNP